MISKVALEGLGDNIKKVPCGFTHFKGETAPFVVDALVELDDAREEGFLMDEEFDMDFIIRNIKTRRGVCRGRGSAEGEVEGVF